MAKPPEDKQTLDYEAPRRKYIDWDKILTWVVFALLLIIVASGVAFMLYFRGAD